MADIPPSSLQSALSRNTGLSLDMLLPISDVLGLSVGYLNGLAILTDSHTSTFAERFKILRLGAGLKQSDIGNILGVSRGAISFYENGDRTPDIDFLAKTSEYFNVSADWLCGLSNTKTKDCEISAVCDYIGLDEDTVSLFRKLKQTQHWNEVISHILRIAGIMDNTNKEESP